MGIVETLDAFLEANSWFSGSIIAVSLLWGVWRYKSTETTRKAGPRALQALNLLSGSLFSAAVLSGHALLLQHFQINAELALALDFVTYLAVCLAICVTIARAIELLVVSRTPFIEAAKIPGLPRLLLFGAALIIGLTAFGVWYGLSINGLYVSTGALAAIIAFAMQRTLGDLFSGISLSVEHPFKIGDWIELEDGTRGEVRDLNWRATRLRDWDNTTVIVPNSKLAGQAFRNYHDAKRRYSPLYSVQLPAEVDPRFAKSLMLEAALKCKRRSKSLQPSVRLVNSGTVPYTYMVWLHFANYPSMFAGREEFFSSLHYALRQAGIQAAPEVQDVRFQRSTALEPTPPSLRQALANLDFTDLFNEDEFETLVAHSYDASFEAGTGILQEGEIAPSVFIILNGSVETNIIDARGRTRAMKPLQAGEYFGLASMLTDAPSFQSFVAGTDVSLAQVDRNCFKAVASQRAELLQGFAEIVEGRMRLVAQARNQAAPERNSGRFYDILRKIETMLNQ